MSKILITGFEPFGGDVLNPALEAIEHLDGAIIGGFEVITHALPVVRKTSIDTLLNYIAKINPDVVIAVGQAGGRSEISIERIAINVDDFRIPDNAGLQPIGEPVIPGGPAAYWSTLPIKAMMNHLNQGGVPALVSNTAGTFVCNHVFYGLMHHLAVEGNIRRGGFIHIPYLPEQVCTKPGQPSMALETIVKGLKLAVEATALDEDVQIGAGTIC